jgi:hypothetical protein
MKLDFIVICDYTAVSPDGKMTIVGTFDRVNSVVTPARLPSLGVALRFRGEKSDAGGKTHKIQLRIKAPDNSMLGQLDAEIALQAGAPVEKLEETSIPLPFMAQNMIFAKHGKYSFEVWMDSRLLQTATLFVGPPVAPLAVTSAPGGLS